MSDELNGRLDKLLAKAEDLKVLRESGDQKAMYRTLGDIEHEAVSALYALHVIVNSRPWSGR